MGLYLIHHRLNTVKGSEIHHSVYIEIRNTDGTDLTLIVQVFQCTVSTVRISERLMQQYQIKIIGLQLSHRLFYGIFSLFIAVMFHPYFGGQEDLLSGNTWLLNSLSYFFLIHIRIGGIDQLVSFFQSSIYRFLCLIRAQEKCSQTCHGHFYAIV